MHSRPKEFAWGPRAVRERDKEILDYIENSMPVSGAEVQFSDGPKGRIPSLLRGQSSGGGSAIIHPFKTLHRVSPENPEIHQARVALGSNLYAGLGNWGNIEILGLDAWFDVAENDYIFLTGTYESGILDSVSIGKASSLPGRIVISTGEDPEQESWTTRIARILFADDAWSVEQNLFQHLTLVTQCIASVPAEYPFPVS